MTEVQFEALCLLQFCIGLGVMAALGCIFGGQR